MSHLEHIFVSINGSWTDKINPPVILPVSPVKVEEHTSVLWDEKARQRSSSWDRDIKGLMSSARTGSWGLQEPAENSAFHWPQVAILCLFFLMIYFHFYISFHGILSWFYQGKDSWRWAGIQQNFVNYPDVWILVFSTGTCSIFKWGKHHFTFSVWALKLLHKPPFS